MFHNNPDQTAPDREFGPAVSYTVGDSASSITSEDFNGDGDPDLAVTNDREIATSGDISIFFGSTTGTSAPAPTDYPAGDNPTAISSDDLDGDDPDLAVANLGEPPTGSPNIGPGSVSALLDNGIGTFAAPVNYPSGDGPRAVITTAFDFDRDPDFAVSYQNETTGPTSRSSSATATAPLSPARTSPGNGFGGYRAGA